MTKKPSVAKALRTAQDMGKSAGQRIAAATKSAAKNVGKAAARVSDLNKDGKVDHEDARIATAKAKRIGSKVADGAGALAKKAAKHDMVKDAAAGAAIGAAVAMPVPIVERRAIGNASAVAADLVWASDLTTRIFQVWSRLKTALGERPVVLHRRPAMRPGVAAQRARFEISHPR